MSTPEPGQSQASADALEAALEAGYRTSDARQEVTTLRRQLREARAALARAQAEEQEAVKAYEATPWAVTR